MKNSFFLLLTGASLLGLAGCADYAYDPTRSTPTVTPGDKIQIVSITAKPEHPVVPQTTQAAIRVKNVSGKTLKDVEYVFDIGATGEEIARGKIASLNPDETVEIKSPAIPFEQGTYRIEGKVFLPKGQEETKYEDRMNNVKAVSVTVTH